jgi:hypothetical protein
MVLGMAGQGFFNEMFSEGQQVDSDRFDQWFDSKAGTLGGKSAIEMVTNLVGHCQSFDLSQLDNVPRKDLPDLIPFFRGALTLNHRRPEQRDGRFSFRTPDAWRTAPAIRTRYEGLIFHRNPSDNQEAARIVGVGHQLFDQALTQATELEATIALSEGLQQPLAIFRFVDAIAGGRGQVRQVVAGVTQDADHRLYLLTDEDVLEQLNQFSPSQRRDNPQPVPPDRETLSAWLDSARDYARSHHERLKLPFRKPQVADLVLLWPVNTGAAE